MSTPRTDEFLALFTALENHMKRVTGHEGFPSFAEVLRSAAQRNSAVKRYRDDLQSFAGLRNIIVHADGYPKRVIAEPSDEALARFRHLVTAVTEPPKLGARRRTLRLFAHGDPLSGALQYMQSEDFSQVVVFDGHLALLTTEGVARWLEAQVAEDIISVAAASVSDALAHETEQAFVVLSANSTVFDAIDAFTHALEANRIRLSAILVTANGRATERPISIITAWDLPSATRDLAVPGHAQSSLDSRIHS